MTITIEGYTVEELLLLPDELLSAYLFSEPTIVFRAGTAELLGRISLHEKRLIVELAEIEGGGEGVLMALWFLANRFAKSRQLSSVEWILHAVTCKNPNLKLRQLLERRGFKVVNLPEIGLVYHLMQDVT